MSEVKVNKISPRTNCGTVQLGDSGDTITIPAGATITNNGTQTGFGRTGTVDWETTPKTATFSAVSGDGFFCNTTSGGFTANLPAGVAGAIVAVADYTRTFATYNCTVAPNGAEKIGGVADDAILNVNGQSATFVYVDGTEGWVNVQETQTSQTGVVPAYVAASGGNQPTPTGCVVDTDYKFHKFTGPGTFTVTCAGNAAGSNKLEYLVIGGGGGTGSRWHAGGGGAGGYRESPGTSAGSYTVSPLGVAPAAALTAVATPYPISVGGGAGGGPAPGNNPAPATTGSTSSFDTITAAGGGSGGTYAGAGNGGGSGGGAGSSNIQQEAVGAGNTPTTTPPQGTPGGQGEYPSGGGSGGGGGGATALGTNWGPSVDYGGDGGNGGTSAIDGTPTGRAGGGAASSTIGGPQAGTATGYGNFPGASAPGSSGTANTGAGGSAGQASDANGGGGGSGIVIIRYKFQ